MIEVSIALLVVLVVLARPSIFFVMGLVVYLIAGIHDLFFVRYRKPNKNEKDCPYEREDK